MDNIFHGVRLAHPKCPIPHSDKIHVDRCPTRLCYRFPLSDLYASNQSEKQQRKKKFSVDKKNYWCETKNQTRKIEKQKEKKTIKRLNTELISGE